MLCDFAAGRSDNLKDHVKSVHLKEDNYNYKCQLCDVTFLSIPSLNLPIKAVHDNIRDNKCPQCDYASAKSSILSIHIKEVHEKIKDKKCPHCENTTAISSSLFRQHQRQNMSSL
jgi:Zn finger protein HypA/HybF involved in hydrogenase expression